MARLFRPRFSVRTLAIFVTLVCAYIGAWEATKRHAYEQIGTGYDRNGMEFDIVNTSSPVAFIVWQDESWGNAHAWDRYYFWAFGLKFMLSESLAEGSANPY